MHIGTTISYDPSHQANQTESLEYNFKNPTLFPDTGLNLAILVGYSTGVCQAETPLYDAHLHHICITCEL
jgi:hypothetical protein